MDNHSPTPHSFQPGESPQSHISPNAYQNAHFRAQSQSESLAPPAPPAENLVDPGRDTFNVDPNVTYMGAADQGAIAQQHQRDAQAETEASHGPGGPGLRSGKRFVGGFIADLKGAMMKNRSQPQDTQRAADAEVERSWTGVPPLAGPSRYRRPRYPHGYVTYDEAQQIQATQPTPPPPQPQQSVASNGLPISAPLPLRRGASQRHTQRPAPPESPPTPQSSSSESQTHVGTTAVSHVSHSDYTHVHDLPPPDPGVLGSPVLVEPRPGSDYAKMSSLGSKPSSGMSFHTHLRRLRRWIAAINALPWIATERVTIDYIPRAARARLAHHPTQQHTFGLQRPLSTWYGNQTDRMSIDLLSGESMSPPTAYPSLPYGALDDQGTSNRGINMQVPEVAYDRRHAGGPGYAPFQLPSDDEPIYYVPMVQTHNAPVTFVTSTSLGHG